MSKEITRIAVYWYPPRQLADILERAWRGDLARKYKDLARRSEDEDESERYKHVHKVCDLLARHCGDCPIWLAHATVLDAICILADDREPFVHAMRDISRQFLPIELAKPEIREWGWANNVFLRWEDGHGPGIQRLRQFRVAIAEEASRFMVIERVSWEVINDMDHLLATLGPLARWEFRRALAGLKRLSQDGNAPRLPYAPNVGLGWYIDRLLSGRDLKDAEFPFPPSPHLSVATAVRADDKYGMDAKDVGDFIKKHLPEIPELTGLLGEEVVHVVDRVHIVEPAPPSVPPLDVTVIDRPTGRPRTELRQPWQPTEELASGDRMQRKVTLV